MEVSKGKHGSKWRRSPSQSSSAAGNSGGSSAASRSGRAATKRERFSRRDLIKGKLSLNEGCTLAPIADKIGKPVALIFTHPVEGEADCERVLPLADPSLPWWRWQSGKWKIHSSDPLRLGPSLWCPEHCWHGFFHNGNIETTYTWWLEAVTEEQIEKAENYLREYRDPVLAVARLQTLLADERRWNKRLRDSLYTKGPVQKGRDSPLL